MKAKIFQVTAAAPLILAGVMLAGSAYAQQGRGAAPAATTPRAAAPLDFTGYWVSQVVDEWRFRVVPQKGDIPYLPLNAEARKVANAWDPDKDVADGKSCKAYGAVGLMQRPGRLHLTWQDDMTLKMDADAGTQTRLFHFGPPPAQKAEATLQGYSQARWVVNGRPLLDTGGTGFVPGVGGRAAAVPKPGVGTLVVTTTNMLPGYLRKNGVPYSDKAVLTEYYNMTPGPDGQAYFVVTAFVEDPTYLAQPFIRTYNFKKQPNDAGWDPTPCWAK